MIGTEYTLLILSIILLLGLMIPDLFKKAKLPLVTVLILLGAILGPFGLDYIQIDSTIEFFGFLGSAFLMFMAGLEVKVSQLRGFGKKIVLLALVNGIVPFAAGLIIARLFGYGWISALIVGVVFISTSIAIAVPAIKAAGIYDTPMGKLMISAIVLEDAISLILLAFIMQGVSPITEFPLLIYFAILIVSLVVLKLFLPRLTKSFLKQHRKKEDEYEDQLRIVLVILMAVLIFFSALGVHPILAAFLVGVLLGDVVTSEKLYEKLHTIGYGVFIPVFFVVVGMEMNLRIFFNGGASHVLLLSIIGGSLLAKMSSGWIAGKIVKLPNKQALRFGVLSTVQLTTTLAATYAAFSLGLIDTPLITALIGLSIVTTLGAPIVLRLLSAPNRNI